MRRGRWRDPVRRLGLARRRAGRRDRGATTMEYIGVLVLVAGVIGLTMTAFVATPLGPGTRELVCRVLSQACAGDEVAAPEPGPTEDVPVDEDFVPPPCMLSEVGEVGSAQVKIAFFTFGDDYGFIERTYADGRVTLTAVKGATLGLIKSGDTQVVDLGRLDDETQVGGSLDISGGIDMDYGDTWSFDDAAQADAMRGQLDDYLVQQIQLQGQGAAGTSIWLWLSDGFVDPPKPAHTTFATIGLDAALSGSFGLQEPTGGSDSDGNPSYLDPNIGIEAAVNGDYDVKVETNHETGERSYTYTLSGAGNVGGNLVVGEASARGSTTGAFKVTRNEAGEITGISMISTREGGVQAGLEASSPVSVPVGPSASGSDRETQATVTEVRLDVDTPEQRQVVQDWLSANNEQFGTPLALTGNAMIPTQANPDDPFENLLFQEASVSQVVYDNVGDTQKFGLDVKAGWELGLSVTLDSWRKDATEANFLGAPRADGTRPMLPDTSCL